MMHEQCNGSDECIECDNYRAHIRRLRDMLASALPRIQCETQEDSNLITAIGEYLEGKD